jgi:hypothetical protein
MTMRSTAGAILALLAFGAAWPSGVQAGCLYAHGPAPGLGAVHLDRLALAGALPVPIHGAEPPAPAPPCAGMRCSNDPAPTPPAALVVAPAAEHWGDLADLVSDPDITSSRLPCDDPAVRPRHGGESPYHPPR